jgi:hypothetical protein
MSKNRHGNGKFASGKSTGQYRGAMKHDASTEAFKTALGTEPGRNPVVSHAGCPSVGTPETLADVSSKGATTFGGPKS